MVPGIIERWKASA